MSMDKSLMVTCPHCKKTSAWDSKNPHRPFCCERCKMIDLGKWANGEYRVEIAPDQQDFIEDSHQA